MPYKLIVSGEDVVTAKQIGDIKFHRVLRVPVYHLLDRLSVGLTYDQLAKEIGVSLHTLRYFLCTKIYPLLGADNVTHAVAIALRAGIIR